MLAKISQDGFLTAHKRPGNEIIEVDLSDVNCYLKNVTLVLVTYLNTICGNIMKLILCVCHCAL